jgi:hypothetical protein
MGKVTATINYMAPLDQLVPKEPPFRVGPCLLCRGLRR